MAMIRPETEMKDSGIQWLGNIPKEWSIIKGKYILKQLSRSVLESDNVVTCFRDGEVTLRSNRRELGFTNSLKEIGYQGVEPGDLVVHGMDGFAGAIGISDSRGKMSPIINVLESGECKKYLMYYLRGLAFVNVFLGLSTGIRERSCDLRWNKLANLEYTIPPLSEQQAIADYLDETCSKIDEIIAEAKASIDEYKTLKQALIAEITTNGLNKNIDFCETNFAWMGKIPSHWELKPFKYVLNERNEKNNPIKSTERLSLSIDKGITLYAEKTTNLDRFKDDFTAYKLAYKGDLVMNSMNMIVGASGVSDYFGCVSPVYYTYFDNEPDHITAKYCEYLFRSRMLMRVLRSLGRGIHHIDRGDDRVNTCRLKVSRDDLRTLVLPVPPICEQRDIVSFLDKRTAEIDSLIAEKQSLIADLEAYKKSLIYEVVTGKRKVV